MLTFTEEDGGIFQYGDAVIRVRRQNGGVRVIVQGPAVVRRNAVLREQMGDQYTDDLKVLHDRIRMDKKNLSRPG